MDFRDQENPESVADDIWANDNVRKVATPIRVNLSAKTMKNDQLLAATCLKTLEETKFEKRVEARTHFEELYSVFSRLKMAVPLTPAMTDEINMLPGYFEHMVGILTFLQTPQYANMF